jgi:hypothetical protein
MQALWSFGKHVASLVFREVTGRAQRRSAEGNDTSLSRGCDIAGNK